MRTGTVQIANDILDGGSVYHTAVDTKPPGIYYIYAGVFRMAGRNNLRAVHIFAIVVVVATALVVRRIGARVGDEWAGAWSGIGYAVFVHAYQPGDTLAANTEIFASLLLALSVLAFLQGKKEAGWGWMFLSGTLVGAATLIRQPSAVNAGVMLACLVYAWLIPRTQSFGSVVRAGSGIVAGFVTPIAGLALYYQSQGNLHDAYLWAWVFAIRYVESETTLPFVLKHLATVHLGVILSWGLLWYFGIRQVIWSWKSLRHTRTGPFQQVLLVLWLGVTYLTIFIGWRFPGHYHLAVLPPLSILAGQAFSRFIAEQPAFSSTALGMDTNRHHWGGGGAGDCLSRHGFRVPNQTLDFSSDCPGDRQEDKPERSHLCLGKLPETLQFLWTSSCDAFR